MWGRKASKTAGAENQEAETPRPLHEAVRQARIEAAERTGVVVDLRDAEAARLELLNEAIDPVFADIPPEVELFDRALSKGETPRLWIDMITYVVMGRDKRVYRFLQDTRYGRKVLLESAELRDVADAVTRYVASRLIERERALAGDFEFNLREAAFLKRERRRQNWRAFRAFVFGMLIGVAGLILALMYAVRS